MVDKYLKYANNFDFINDTPFLKFFLPFISVVGTLTFLYFAYKGIVKKNTISLTKFENLTFKQSSEVSGKITGGTAILYGIIYLIYCFYSYYIYWYS